jgi:hypothetical protein
MDDDKVYCYVCWKEIVFYLHPHKFYPEWAYHAARYLLTT